MALARKNFLTAGSRKSICTGAWLDRCFTSNCFISNAEEAAKFQATLLSELIIVVLSKKGCNGYRLVMR